MTLKMYTSHMLSCAHGESLYGRCALCGMTWDEQALNSQALGHGYKALGHVDIPTVKAGTTGRTRVAVIDGAMTRHSARWVNVVLPDGQNVSARVTR